MTQPAEQFQSIGSQLRDEIAKNQLTLPTLPEVALQVRDAVEDDCATAAQIADMVAKDPALAARLLQVANSPLYRGRVEVDNLAMAINRLGLKLVRSLVISLAMKQMFQATSDSLDRAFRKVWDDCVQVAAISRVLSKRLADLEPEQAMLAGLVHQIGSLPVLARIDQLLDDEPEEELIERLIDELAPGLGRAILTHWHFPDSLVQIPEAVFDYSRERTKPDYADVVMVARLQYLMGTGHLPEGVDLSTISAFERVELEPEIVVMDMEGPAEEIAEVQALFSG
jgi:HD-like signal output (HDOD) protein